MNLRKHIILGATLAALLGGMALPASAADTATTFVINAGALTFSVQGTATLSPAASGALSVTGSLGAVSVSDVRGGVAEWAVSAASTAFTGTSGSSSTAVSYTAGVVSETGSITVGDGTLTTLTIVNDVPVAASVVSATVLSGNNT